MKKALKIFCSVLVVFVMISGCGKKDTEEVSGSNVATRVDIHSITREETIHRCYTQPSKIEAVLIYLRLLRPKGPVKLPADQIREYYEITVHLSNGSRRVYRQCADSYATTLQGWWGLIDTRYGQELPRLIHHIPSDVPSENPENSY